MRNQTRPGVQVLNLENVQLGSASQLERLAPIGRPGTARLTALSGLRRLELHASEGRKHLSAVRQLAALAPHARQLTALVLLGWELLKVTCELAELADSLRLLPELRELEVREAA